MDDLNAVFANIKTIMACNQQFLADLEKHKELEPHERASKTMVTISSYAGFFKMYSVYINNYDNAMRVLCRLRQNPVVAAFIRACELQPTCHNKVLSDFLIQPVQRMPRYRLLLQQVLKATGNGYEEERELIRDALKKIEESTHTVNSQVHENEAREKVQQLKDEFGVPELVTPSRRFVKEGFLSKISRRGPKKFRFVLFNDLLIYGTQESAFRTLTLSRGNGTWKVNHWLELQNVAVVDKGVPTQQNGAFAVLTAEKSFIAFADSTGEAAEWVSAVRECQSLMHIGVPETNDTTLGDTRGSASTYRGSAEKPNGTPSLMTLGRSSTYLGEASETDPGLSLSPEGTLYFSVYLNRDGHYVRQGIKIEDQSLEVVSLDEEFNLEEHFCEEDHEQAHAHGPERRGSSTTLGTLRRGSLTSSRASNQRDMLASSAYGGSSRNFPDKDGGFELSNEFNVVIDKPEGSLGLNLVTSTEHSITGCLIAELQPNCALKLVGARQWDLITQLNGNRVSTPAQIKDILVPVAIGGQLTFTLVRRLPSKHSAHPPKPGRRGEGERRSSLFSERTAPPSSHSDGRHSFYSDSSERLSRGSGFGRETFSAVPPPPPPSDEIPGPPPPPPVA
mmetsp:Transcript_20022/g.60632  ORF Transcript_20022/g.60632 Transcript_20022/m.60632 type:complete len:619 (+) Transcript_20022:1010-2866(+)